MQSKLDTITSIYTRTIENKRLKPSKKVTYKIRRKHQNRWYNNKTSAIAEEKYNTLNETSPEKINETDIIYNNEEKEWFFTESGQKQWVDAMELNTITPELPNLLKEMGIKYDPERLANVLGKKRIRLYKRAIEISTSLGYFFTRIAQDYATNQLEKNQYKRAKELTNILTKLGASFVKIGQALSSRPDLLPRPYLEALSDLQDNLPSFPRDIAISLIEEELGGSIENNFAYISDTTVAAASLGQVYKGKLLNGEDVAIKVQRPGIGENIALDMILLRRLIKIVDKNINISHDIVPLVDEFASKLFAELDYISEGHNCEKFTELYGNLPKIKTPKIHWKYTSRRVLTMEWIEGIKLTDVESMAAAGLKVTDFVDIGIECTLNQLLEHGFFHADPHPGNLLALKSGELAYLDFGMMSNAPEKARYAIIGHFVHLVNRDYEAMCQDYYILEFVDRSVDTSPIAPELANFFDDVLDQPVNNLNFKSIVDGLGDVLFQYPFRAPGYYALILRSLTVLEGLALQADPNYKLIGKTYPYMANRILMDPVPELRTTFEDLIIKKGEFRWNRLENLIKESSKSHDFDPSKLWLILDWLVSPPAKDIRLNLVKEIARIIDAWVAGTARSRLANQVDSSLADLLVPELPQEASSRERAKLLSDVILKRISKMSSQNNRDESENVTELIREISTSASNTVPKIIDLARKPGGIELLSELSQNLGQRFIARSLKFFLGYQESQQNTENKINE